MEINSKRDGGGSDDYCRKTGQSVFPGFPTAGTSSSWRKSKVYRAYAVDGGMEGGGGRETSPVAGGKNYFSSFHRFLISLQNEKKALVVVLKFGRPPESHLRTNTRDRFHLSPSSSLSIVRLVFVPQNGFGGCDSGKTRLHTLFYAALRSPYISDPYGDIA